jgi:hypothetical protein
MEATTTTVNPVIAALSTEELAAALAARGVEVKAKKTPKEKVEKVEKTDEELLLEAVTLLVKVGEDGKLYVIPVADRAEGTEAATVFAALSLKSRTTLAKIEDAKKPPVEGKKRGPKSKAEKEAAALAAAAASNPDGAKAPEGEQNAAA